MVNTRFELDYSLTPVSDSHELLAAYENLRDVLPVAQYPENYARSRDLEGLTHHYDAFLFDAFGVLNIGESAIAGAAERIAAVRRAGRHVMVVSNAASVPVASLQKKYHSLGFDFRLDEIVTSRLALVHYLRAAPAMRWGVIAGKDADTTDLGVTVTNLAVSPDAFDHVDGFILVSTKGWTESLQEQLQASLMTRTRPVLLANPDIAAPREDGFSVEPGQLAHSLRIHTGCQPVAFGKPYPSIYDIALNKLPAAIAHDRVLMVGDTLHTDVLGGCNAGVHTALVTAHGACATLDWADAIRQTGIVPHHVLDHI